MFALFFVRFRSTTFHIIFDIIFALCFARFSHYFCTILCPIFPRERADTIFYTNLFKECGPRSRPELPTLIFPSIFGGSEPPNVEPQKIALSRPGVSETPARWVPSWTTKSSTLEAQVGLHFGGGIGPPRRRKAIFWRPKLPRPNGPPPKINL